MVRAHIRMIAGVVLGVVLPAVRVVAQEAPIQLQVLTDGNGNAVAAQTMPDGTVRQLDMSQLRANGIVIDPGDVGREFTIGGNGAAPMPKSGGGPALDLAQVRQQAVARFASMMKQEMGCTDVEWGVLEPKIQAVQLLQSALGIRPRSAGDKSATVPMPTVMAAVTELRTKQGDLAKSIGENHPEQDIKSRMVSLREARSRAMQELTRLQKELTELLTIRQESVLLQKQILE